jgi:hypothetical protein
VHAISPHCAFLVQLIFVEVSKSCVRIYRPYLDGEECMGSNQPTNRFSLHHSARVDFSMLLVLLQSLIAFVNLSGTSGGTDLCRFG